jgi:hypothetical protein
MIRLILLLFLVSCSARNEPKKRLKVFIAADDRYQMIFFNCACSHKGYLLVYKSKFWWYIPRHKSVNIKGEVEQLNSKSIKITNKNKAVAKIDNDEKMFDYEMEKSFLLKKVLLSIEEEQKVKKMMEETIANGLN